VVPLLLSLSTGSGARPHPRPRWGGRAAIGFSLLSAYFLKEGRKEEGEKGAPAPFIILLGVRPSLGVMLAAVLFGGEERGGGEGETSHGLVLLMRLILAQTRWGGRIISLAMRFASKKREGGRVLEGGLPLRR